LQQVISIAQEHNIIVLCDEVYQPLFHSIDDTDPQFPPSALLMGYKNVIVTGSMSKAFGLAGIRVGWIASWSSEFIEAFAGTRDYTQVSVSQLDDQVAAFATTKPCVDNLLSRNIELAQTNLKILEQFVQDHKEICTYVRPIAGTIAFVRFQHKGQPVDDTKLCRLVHELQGVLIVPGSHCFGGDHDFKGYVRIGFVCATEELQQGLKGLDSFISDHYHLVSHE
jgi:aspartate/methionine/tyrosine aminotransferase